MFFQLYYTLYRWMYDAPFWRRYVRNPDIAAHLTLVCLQLILPMIAMALYLDRYQTSRAIIKLLLFALFMIPGITGHWKYTRRRHTIARAVMLPHFRRAGRCGIIMLVTANLLSLLVIVAMFASREERRTDSYAPSFVPDLIDSSSFP
jgi:formate hydrogenlyase subunit 3/multisubunit Na+/H+ antiporter MnhD subunit